ncbi:hypothetical protein HYV11_00670 [Candidatus Dependentiae bacterium]|nr:hypothetical protein [Candidatus Dependentiae bacterium]
MLNFKKRVLFGILATVALAQAESSTSDACSSSCASSCESSKSQNLWQPHAFSAYGTREILLMKDIDFSVDKEWVSRFGVASEYMQSFNNDNCSGLGALPFWSGTNKMTIGDNSGNFDLDAYQFGMGYVNTVNGEVQSGKVTLAPKIQQVGSELMWYLVQNKDKPGFYSKIKLPLGAMMVNAKLCEDPASMSNENAYYHDRTGIAGYVPANYYPTLSAALAGGTVQQDPVYKYGKFECCRHTTIRMGDIGAVLGVNFIVKDEGHFGIGAKFSCPTGNVPTAEYALEPIFGRAGHWGVGGEITGHYKHEMENDRYWTFWVQGEAMHLFSGRRPSWRSFDLKANGKGSKYMLIQNYFYSYGTITAGDFDVAINYTTLPVKSSFAIEGNLAMMFDFHHKNMNFAIGGEFWGRSDEKLSIDTCNLNNLNNYQFDYNLNDWAVVGRQLDGYCEPLATINKSQTRYSGQGALPEGVVDATVASNRISQNYNDALDICGAAAHQIFTGKVTGELGYTWSDHKHVPHVGLFGGAEFAVRSERFVNLWSVGLQGTLQF